MYLVVLLKNGTRKEVARYDSPSEFRFDYPTISYVIVGLVIYIHEDVE